MRNSKICEDYTIHVNRQRVKHLLSSWKLKDSHIYFKQKLPRLASKLQYSNKTLIDCILGGHCTVHSVTLNEENVHLHINEFSYSNQEKNFLLTRNPMSSSQLPPLGEISFDTRQNYIVYLVLDHVKTVEAKYGLKNVWKTLIEKDQLTRFLENFQIPKSALSSHTASAHCEKFLPSDYIVYLDGMRFKERRIC